MSGSIEGAYRETDVYQATERRMLGGAMYIYLPRPGKTPDDVLASLAEERANGSAPAWEDDRHGELFLPRFKLAWSDSLARPLKRLGMPLAFDPREADFTALSDTPVWIDDVVHAATTEVDETGIEAAAATVVVMRATAAAPSPKPPVEMRVDRPFVYEVVSGGMPLFIGVVEDPR
jgi:serpin B